MTFATTASTLLKLRQTFATHGLPCTLVSDNKSISRISKFCKVNGIKHIRSAPYHTASNGLAERAAQTLKAGLKKTPGPDL